MPAVKQIALQKLGRRLVSLLCNILSEGYLNARGNVRANGLLGLTAVVVTMVTAQIH